MGKLTFGVLAAIAIAVVVVWLVQPRETINAQAAIQDACKDAEAINSGIVSMTAVEVRAGETNNIEWDIRFGGDNRSWHIMFTNLKMGSETYFVGDKRYSREHTSPGVWGDWQVSTFEIPVQSAPLGPVGQVDDTDEPLTFCGIEGLVDHSYQGVKRVGGEDLEHYTAAIDDDLLGQGNSVELGFWINDSGQMKQFSIDEEYVDGLDIELTGVLSRIGDPITVTAPVIP